MKATSDVFLLLMDAAEQDAELLRVISEAASAPGLQFVPCHGIESVDETLRNSSGTQEMPFAVLISPNCQRPLAAARRIHRLAPTAQIIFLAHPQQKAQLQRDMALTPMIGSQWTIAAPESQTLSAVLEQAQRTSRQRQRLRTTLDRINVQLAARPATDSTDYRKLVISNSYLASILAHAQDAIISTDDEGKIITWNRAAEQLLGVGEQQALGQRIDSLGEGSCAGQLSQAIAAIREGEAVVRKECVFERADGTAIDIEVSLAPVQDEMGHRIAISLIARDITERRQTEENLRNQQQWLEAVLDLAPSAILLIEPGTARVIFANRAADEMAGGEFPQGKVAEEYHTIYYCTDEKGNRIPDEQMPGVRVARGERLHGFQMDWHTPKGKRSLTLYADTLPAAYGHPATAMVLFQDISEIKQVQAELQRANQIKDDFLATVSHELRTPLNAILGWATLLRSGKLDAVTVDKALETIERNAKSQAHLVEDLLDISRIISGKLRLDVTLIDLSSVIQNAVETVRPAAEAKSIRLQVILDPKAGPVSGDANRLQQVVWNLLSNAVKFTPKNGRVQVRLERINSHLEITVSDSGPGIPEEFLPHIFDRFSQADSSITRSFSGLGLGLSIVRHLAELHGGTVMAANGEDGRGAIFTVHLPLAIVQSPDHPLRRAEERVHPAIGMRDTSEAGVSGEMPSLEGLLILVVDDEPDARAFLATLFQGHGAEVLLAASAAEAMELLQSAPEERKPHIMVADIGMPDEDGYSLIRRVRALEAEQGGHIPSLALTAFARAEDRRKALLAGFQMHMAKPVDMAELLTVVSSLTGRIAGTKGR